MRPPWWSKLWRGQVLLCHPRKADPGAEADKALADCYPWKRVKAGKKAVISGFVDSTGNEQNAELAKRRAIGA